MNAMNSTLIGPNTRVTHRTHPEYGFGLVRYVEEDTFGDQRLQVAFDHLDNLENVAPAEVEIVPDPLADAATGRWGDVAAFRRKLAAGLVIGENNLTGGFIFMREATPVSSGSEGISMQRPLMSNFQP